MRYNINAGYGKDIPNKLDNGNQGKLLVVGKASLAHRNMYTELFTPDVDGTDRYFATIDAAINSCTDNSGDKIVVLPGHTETISSATAINADVAGISIVGLGYGNDRATITFDTAASTTIPVSAANITFENIIFTANYADIVSVFTLTTAKNFTVKGCYIKATATDKNFKGVIDTGTTTSAADGLTLINNKWIEPDTATLSMVKQDGDNSDVTIENNFVQLGVNNNKSALLTVADGKSVFNLEMLNNKVFRLNTDTATGGILFHTNQSDNSGIVAGNFAQHADTAGELLITASSGLGTFENYASGVAGASGYLLPAADS